MVKNYFGLSDAQLNKLLPPQKVTVKEMDVLKVIDEAEKRVKNGQQYLLRWNKNKSGENHLRKEGICFHQDALFSFNKDVDQIFFQIIRNCLLYC